MTIDYRPWWQRERGPLSEEQWNAERDRRAAAIDSPLHRAILNGWPNKGPKPAIPASVAGISEVCAPDSPASEPGLRRERG